jgi:hypothetical protein
LEDDASSQDENSIQDNTECQNRRRLLLLQDMLGQKQDLRSEATEMWILFKAGPLLQMAYFDGGKSLPGGKFLPRMQTETSSLWSETAGVRYMPDTQNPLQMPG